VKKKSKVKQQLKHNQEPITVNMEQLRLSFSAVDTYLRCGKQFEFRYIDNIKSIPGVALLEGSSHHKAMEVNNNHKIGSGEDKNPSYLTDIFMGDFRERVKAEELGVDWGDEKEDGIFKRAKTLHERYINDVAPGIHPEEVEKRFELPLDLPDERGKNPVSVLLVGVADLKVPKVIFDYKTAAKSKGQSEVDQSLQLSLYAYAEKVPQVGIIEFLKKANPEVGVLTSGRTMQQKIWALHVVRSVALAIKAGVFPLAAPNTWSCSSRFCGYFSRCRGKFA
jgi:hypothetical protein